MPASPSTPPGMRSHPRTRTSLPSMRAFDSRSRRDMRARASVIMPRAQQAKNTWRSWTGPMGMPQSSMRWRRRSAGLALPAFWHMPRTREQRASGAASARSPRSTSARRASRATHASWVSSASTARDTRPREVPEGRFCTPAPSRPVMAVAPRPAAADADAPRAPSAADSRSARAAARLFCRFAVFPIAASVASSPARALCPRAMTPRRRRRQLERGARFSPPPPEPRTNQSAARGQISRRVTDPQISPFKP